MDAKLESPKSDATIEAESKDELKTSSRKVGRMSSFFRPRPSKKEEDEEDKKGKMKDVFSQLKQTLSLDKIEVKYYSWFGIHEII